MIKAIRILGALMIVLGAIFLISGIDESGTFANRFMKEMAGSYTKETKQQIVGGAALVVLGFGLLSVGFFKKKRR